MWLIEIVLVVVGTALWFFGPLFARKIPQHVSCVISGGFPEHTADDAWRLRWPDRVQSLGATFIISSILLPKLSPIYVLITSILVFVLLWDVRTFVYYHHWVMYYYGEQYNGLGKLKYLFIRMPIFAQLLFYPKRVIKMSEDRFKDKPKTGD